MDWLEKTRAALGTVTVLTFLGLVVVDTVTDATLAQRFVAPLLGLTGALLGIEVALSNQEAIANAVARLIDAMAERVSGPMGQDAKTQGQRPTDADNEGD